MPDDVVVRNRCASDATDTLGASGYMFWECDTRMQKHMTHALFPRCAVHARIADLRERTDVTLHDRALPALDPLDSLVGWRTSDER